jgi:hypothetical protein
MSSLELVISLRYDTPETTTTRAPGALQRWPSILTSIAPGFDRFAFAFTVNQLRARNLGSMRSTQYLMPRVIAADRREPSRASRWRRWFRVSGELVRCVADRLDDVVEGFEDGVCEPVLAEVLADVLDRVQLRGARWKPDRRDIVGHVELARRVPACAIEDQHGMGARSDVARDLIEMKLHRLVLA